MLSIALPDGEVGCGGVFRAERVRDGILAPAAAGPAPLRSRLGSMGAVQLGVSLAEGGGGHDKGVEGVLEPFGGALDGGAYSAEAALAGGGAVKSFVFSG